MSTPNGVEFRPSFLIFFLFFDFFILKALDVDFYFHVFSFFSFLTVLKNHGFREFRCRTQVFPVWKSRARISLRQVRFSCCENRKNTIFMQKWAYGPRARWCRALWRARGSERVARRLVAMCFHMRTHAISTFSSVGTAAWPLRPKIAGRRFFDLKNF